MAIEVQQLTGLGTLLKYGGLSSPPSYATIGLVKDIKGPEQSATIIDATTQDVTDNRKRKIGALVDAGTVTFQAWFNIKGTQHAALYNNVGALAYFTLTPAGNSPVEVITFQAVIQKVGNTFPVDGGQMMEVTLDISGTVAVTP